MTAAAILVRIGSVAVFIVAVWFGASVLAPRIGRMADRVDRSEDAEEEAGDGTTDPRDGPA